MFQCQVYRIDLKFQHLNSSKNRPYLFFSSYYYISKGFSFCISLTIKDVPHLQCIINETKYKF